MPARSVRSRSSNVLWVLRSKTNVDAFHAKGIIHVAEAARYQVPLGNTHSRSSSRRRSKRDVYIDAVALSPP